MTFEIVGNLAFQVFFFATEVHKFPRKSCHFMISEGFKMVLSSYGICTFFKSEHDVEYSSLAATIHTRGTFLKNSVHCKDRSEQKS